MIWGISLKKKRFTPLLSSTGLTIHNQIYFKLTFSGSDVLNIHKIV